MRWFFDDVSEIDRFVFDSKSGAQQGGTGRLSHWSLIPAHLKHKIILAGGINPDNVEDALAQHCVGIDLNSGVESAPGVKNAEKVRSVLQRFYSMTKLQDNNGAQFSMCAFFFS